MQQHTSIILYLSINYSAKYTKTRTQKFGCIIQSDQEVCAPDFLYCNHQVHRDVLNTLYYNCRKPLEFNIFYKNEMRVKVIKTGTKKKVNIICSDLKVTLGYITLD
jgi:hypothetical protein